MMIATEKSVRQVRTGAQPQQEQDTMAFVNEFVSDEDIQKYDLYGIWDQYYPARKGKYYVGQRPAWTMDRERNIFFLPIPLLERDSEAASKQRCLLWWNGIHLKPVITLSSESNAQTTVSPFKQVWELVSLYLPEGFDVPREEVTQALKDALTTYGYSGIHRQIPNTIVEFKF